MAGQTPRVPRAAGVAAAPELHGPAVTRAGTRAPSPPAGLELRTSPRVPSAVTGSRCHTCRSPPGCQQHVFPAPSRSRPCTRAAPAPEAAAPRVPASRKNPGVCCRDHLLCNQLADPVLVTGDAAGKGPACPLCRMGYKACTGTDADNKGGELPAGRRGRAGAQEKAGQCIPLRSPGRRRLCCPLRIEPSAPSAAARQSPGAASGGGWGRSRGSRPLGTDGG